ncbi:DNA topoisomerase IB [Luteimonas sp. MC1572]|uniref:DNA topoisomerase IB n=1 Tax=Luteimonas sp. MC1572 TaxID=2799325 RepID=UPI0018F05C57|nr:DNA topoisomerase IB [Luteimonas sp. MC1572]MBJ6982019.1 DNA topoisomerase IB [Luteimonas sp. MC1572]QQO03318.1 DNA topoisomerase IB [Luteimonas sp. MC1572]
MPAARDAADNPDAGAAKAAGLVHVSDAEPGIARRRAGRGFSYRDAAGRTVRDADTLARIRALAIPPAYVDVWICASPRGHLQATGRDARGRKQYRYHLRWSEVRGDGKFERVVAFGEALPRLRRRLRTDLGLPGYPRDKVLAIVVALMADTLVRVGNDAYARSNRSYGLTTLRNRHVAFLAGGRARLRFRGKGGQDHDIELDDRRLARLVRGVQQLPGQQLFQYRDDDGAPQPVTSDLVNDYLRTAMGDDFTAKDFRTWGGTLHATRLFAATPPPEGRGAKPPAERALAAAESGVLAEVAGLLGNTVSVCRKAYVDPTVLAAWRDGRLARLVRDARGARQWEQATLRLLKSARGRKAKKSRP